VYPEARLRARRDQKKLLGLVRAIAYLRQAQKAVKTTEVDSRLAEYVEVDAEDLALARHLGPAVLGPMLDELSVPARRLLGELGRMKEARQNGAPVRWSRRQIREATGWTNHQVKTHLRELVELEYLVVVRGGRLGSRYEYELLDGDVEPPALPNVFGGRADA
jgi:hypothetical protein